MFYKGEGFVVCIHVHLCTTASMKVSMAHKLILSWGLQRIYVSYVDCHVKLHVVACNEGGNHAENKEWFQITYH